MRPESSVVICLHFSIFDLLETTPARRETDVSQHQETYQRIEPLTVCALGTAEVSNKSDQQNYHQDRKSVV